MSVNWGKQTSRNFKDIIMRCAKETEGITPADDLFLLDTKDPECIKEFYDKLPYSVQKTLNIYTLGKEDYTLPINVKFDRECLDYENEQLKLHCELSMSERDAVKQTLKEICDMVDGEFIGSTQKGEFLVRKEKQKDMADFLVALVSTRLGGVKMKYVAPTKQDEVYRLYFERNLTDDPVENRYRFIRSSISFRCPKCDENDLKSVKDDEEYTTFCCLWCGLAAEIKYTDIQRNFEPDTPSSVIRSACEEKLDEVYTNRTRIDIKDDLRYIGETERVTLYEDVSFYENSDKFTNLWIYTDDAPVVMYSIDEQQFLDEYDPQSVEMLCAICNEQGKSIRSEGAYYEPGAGFHEKEVNICISCQEDLLYHVRKILRTSDDTHQYMQQLL